MKKNIKLLSIIMIIILLVSFMILPASAVRAPLQYGDANADYNVDITDVTEIQRYLAKHIKLTDFGLFAADVDADNDISIIDATYIQRKLAQLIDEFPVGYWCFIDVYAEALTADYSSGKAMAGVPVTFEAIASGGPGELKYTFYIDGEVVKESSCDNVFVHTFTDPGTYHVEYHVVNAVGIDGICGFDYTVVEPYDTTGMVSIQSIYHKGFYYSSPTFEVIASEGEKPYEYKFELYMVGYATNGESEFETLNLVEIQDYSQSNSFSVSAYLESYDYVLTVYVKDASGYEVSENYKFTYELPPPA